MKRKMRKKKKKRKRRRNKKRRKMRKKKKSVFMKNIFFLKYILRIRIKDYLNISVNSWQTFYTLLSFKTFLQNTCKMLYNDFQLDA